MPWPPARPCQGLRIQTEIRTHPERRKTLACWLRNRGTAPRLALPGSRPSPELLRDSYPRPPAITSHLAPAALPPASLPPDAAGPSPVQMRWHNQTEIRLQLHPSFSWRVDVPWFRLDSESRHPR